MLDFIDQKRIALLDHLRRHVDGEVRFDTAARKLYSTDASIYQIEPLGVVLPRNPAALQAAVQIAVEMEVAIVPRGGGTSLSGQSIGAGLVIDCSKYLNQILDVDPAGMSARVQSGVVLDQLNCSLAPHGLMFGPDVATASRANLGGMIGNNSAGSHSIVYGKTIDHVRRLDVILSDGSRAVLGPLAASTWRQREDGSFLGSIYRSVRSAVETAAPDIAQRFPRILRRVSGYNLDAVAAALGSSRAAGGDRGEPVHGPPPHPQPLCPGGDRGGEVGLHQLVIGGEGTLAFVTEADLRLVRRPKAVGLLVPQFSSLAAALDTLAVCLEYAPSAVELLDRLLLELAHANLSLRGATAPLSTRAAALFMVEFSGEDLAEVRDRIDKLNQRLQRMPGLLSALPAIEPEYRDPLWGLRNAAVPLVLGMPGDRKPVTFIEDTAVAAERLPVFVERFRDILAHHGTDGAFYGHASVGCLHIRPLLNLKDKADVARMRRIAEDVTDLVLEFGGSLSGEHGDGLARSEWNRKMFGETIYSAFCRVKEAFDPNNLFNPGKVVDAPPMTEHLRLGPPHAAEPDTLFDYARQEGFTRAIELCNGSGVCRKLQGGTMCPSFRATRDEKDSTRGRANALRLALAGEQPIKELRQEWVRDVLDLCLMCKACKSECPSNVDVTKLKAEWLSLYYRDRQRPLGQWLMANVHRVNRLGALAPRLVNRMQQSGVFRWLLEKTGGIDQRRSLPVLHEETLRQWMARRGRRDRAGLADVLLLDDCFTNFNEPQIGQAAVRVLEAAGLRVRLAGLTCCGRALISKGYLAEARKLIQTQAPRLAAAGLPILGIEPSCLLTLCDEWPELLPGPATQAVARAAHLADAWLARELDARRRTLLLRDLPERCVIHGHCHQKALVGVAGTAELLRCIPGVDVRVLETGCCGMAGSFGYEKAHYDISTAIARIELLPALEQEPLALIVAPGTSCRHQIKDLTPRRALHPLEVVANRLSV
jgi:FAD/FMN-containing dehydrogenase/Fe-S oxidoreductase